ncbi:MAG TPA: EF-hand domain-containing protein [Rhizomicrobium sp.]|nr:EF-hand domain-containing protein [Rhizomicrobium sp.]
MKKSFRFALLGGAVLAICAGAALAQIEDPPPPDMPGGPSERPAGRLADRFLAEFDLNRDGKVTHDEFNRTLAAHFQQIAGKAGYVTEDQFVAAHLKDVRARSDAMFRRLDWNGDGRVSLDEFLAPARARFELADRDGSGTVDCALKQQASWSGGAAPERVDQNGFSHRRLGGFRGRGNLCSRNDLNEDGKLTRGELDKAVAATYTTAGRGASLTPDEFYGIMAARYRDVAGRMFARADADRDGKLTLAEFAAREEKYFARLDRNGDGVITADELSSRRGAPRGRRTY